MDRLPLEIYNQITSYLTCSEKRKLLLVCRYWHDMIKHGNLFNNFSIKGARKFEAAALFFQENELHRKQVRSLRLTKPEADIDYILTIPQRFPWLRDFVWGSYGNTDYEKVPAIDTDKVKSWRNITSFGEINRYPLSVEILKFDGFSNLTKLMINLHFGNAFCSSLFEQIKHAPKLKQLDFSSANMTLLDLKTLHDNAPQLEALYLTGITQQQIEIPEEPVNIAECLTDLRIRNMKLPWGGFGLLSSWMAFVATRYKKLENLSIDGVGMGRARQDYYEARLTDIAAGCSHLTSYKVNIFPITPSILTAMDGNKIQLKRIDVIQDPDVEQIQHLLDSDQSHSLETIAINDTHLDSNTLFGALERFSKLKHLEIGNRDRQSLSLDILFQKLQYLETLYLSTWTICLDDGPTRVQGGFQTRLKCLTLEKVTINNVSMDVMSFVSRTCPELSKLSIQGQIQDASRMLRVEFPRHYFALIKLDILGNEYYKISSQRQTTWYKFKGRNLQESFQISNGNTGQQAQVSLVYEGSTSLNIGGTDIPNW